MLYSLVVSSLNLVLAILRKERLIADFRSLIEAAPVESEAPSEPAAEIAEAEAPGTLPLIKISFDGWYGRRAIQLLSIDCAVGIWNTKLFKQNDRWMLTSRTFTAEAPVESGPPPEPAVDVVEAAEPSEVPSEAPAPGKRLQKNICPRQHLKLRLGPSPLESHSGIDT